MSQTSSNDSILESGIFMNSVSVSLNSLSTDARPLEPKEQAAALRDGGNAKPFSQEESTELGYPTQVSNPLTSPTSKSPFPGSDQENADEKRKLSKNIPVEYTGGHYDGLIICSEDDLEEADCFVKTLKSICLNDGSSPKVELYYDVLCWISARFEKLEEAVKRSSYIFLYLTKTFCESTFTRLQAESCIMSALETDTKKWNVIPVISSKRDFTIPMVLKSLHCIRISRMDKFVMKNIKQFLEDGYASRLEREQHEKLMFCKYLRQKNKKQLFEKETANVPVTAGIKQAEFTTGGSLHGNNTKTETRDTGKGSGSQDNADADRNRLIQQNTRKETSKAIENVEKKTDDCAVYSSSEAKGAREKNVHRGHQRGLNSHRIPSSGYRSMGPTPQVCLQDVEIDQQASNFLPTSLLGTSDGSAMAAAHGSPNKDSESFTKQSSFVTEIHHHRKTIHIYNQPVTKFVQVGRNRLNVDGITPDLPVDISRQSSKEKDCENITTVTTALNPEKQTDEDDTQGLISSSLSTESNDGNYADSEETFRKNTCLESDRFSDSSSTNTVETIPKDREDRIEPLDRSRDEEETLCKQMNTCVISEETIETVSGKQKNTCYLS